MEGLWQPDKKEAKVRNSEHSWSSRNSTHLLAERSWVSASATSANLPQSILRGLDGETLGWRGCREAAFHLDKQHCQVFFLYQYTIINKATEEMPPRQDGFPAKAVFVPNV